MQTPASASTPSAPSQPSYSKFLTWQFAGRAFLWSAKTCWTVIDHAARITAKCMYWFIRAAVLLTAGILGVR
ncbi:hypothetical protein [Castellaniella sp. UC4442_H9]